MGFEMIILTDEKQYAGARAVLALGMFDGVHIGHRALITRAVRLARELNADAIACTFDKNPLALLAPERAPEPLMSADDRLAEFAALGADYALVKPFTREFSEVSAEDYLANMVSATRCAAIVSGANYTFGRYARGDANMLRAMAEALGFRIEIVAQVTDNGETVSSTLIRNLIKRGEIARAERLLGKSARERRVL